MTIPTFVRRWHDDQDHPVRGRPLWVCDDGSLLLGRDDGGISHFNPVMQTLHSLSASPFTFSLKSLAVSRLAARLMRMAPRAIVRLPSGVLLWVAGKQLWRLRPGEYQPESTYRFEIGSGPLFLAFSPDGAVVFGDYVASREKRPSAIRRSIDEGRSWQIVHEFSASSIRHVHGAFWDPFASRICLTTGDADHEAGLWMLEGDKPVLIAGGRSLFRMVQPVFTEDAIFFGTDTPGENCGIYRMSRQDGRIDCLKPTRGPVFFGTSAGNRLAFTTVVEPGHPERWAALYTGDIDGYFQETLALPKDSYNMRLFQYGQIHLTSNNTALPRLWFTPWAIDGDHQLCSLEDTCGRPLS